MFQCQTFFTSQDKAHANLKDSRTYPQSAYPMALSVADRGKKRRVGKYKNCNIWRRKRAFFGKIEVLSFGEIYKNSTQALSENLQRKFFNMLNSLGPVFTHCRNQAIDLHCKLIVWFYYDGNVGLELVQS